MYYIHIYKNKNADTEYDFIASRNVKEKFVPTHITT